MLRRPVAEIVYRYYVRGDYVANSERCGRVRQIEECLDLGIYIFCPIFIR